MDVAERWRLLRWGIGALALIAGLVFLWVETTPIRPGPIGLRTRAGLVLAFVLVPTAAIAYLSGRYGKGRIFPWVVTVVLAISIQWWMLLLFFTRSYACGPGAAVCGSPHSARAIGMATALFVWLVAVGAEARGLDHRDRAHREPAGEGSAAANPT